MKPLLKPIKLSGKVILGEKVGRTIGFPTANLQLTQPIKNLKKGVYASICQLKGKTYLGLAYYGPRYIFNQPANSFEVYLFNLNKDVYHQSLKVTLTHFLRPPKKVTSLAKLKSLLQTDLKTIQTNQVVLVNHQDKIIGIQGKKTAHLQQGQLHRAISVYIFNRHQQLLIQQRSKHKFLWPLFWSNTCCSHPQPGESYLAAANRRLHQELGLKAQLKLHHQFIYQSAFKNIGSERELVKVFIGFSNQKPKLNRKEVADYQYLSLFNLNQDIKANPQKYTPWFKLTLKSLNSSDILTS